MNIGLGIGIPFAKSQIWLSLFDPGKLFTAGVNGAWYDPSDLTTLYRDAAGTQPVTAVEQPVGLMLDKSKGLVLGPELVTNGDFSNGTTGWNGSGGSVVNGRMNVTGLFAQVTQQLAVTAGKTYEIVYDAFYFNVNPLMRVYDSPSGGNMLVNSFGAGLQKRVLFTATTSVALVSCWVSDNGAGQYVQYDNISVRELPGNHAFNPSGNSANFPVLSARYNLLTKTEDFSDAVWTKQAGTTVSSTKVAAPDGTLTAFSVTGNGTSGVYQGISGSVSIGQSTRSVYLRSPSGAASVGIKDPAQTQGTATCNLTTSWQRFTLTETTPPTSGFVAGIWIFNIPAAGIEIAWPDIRSTNDTLNQPAYQRVNTSTDYDTVGFKPYLRFNGTNQWLQTNSIDFTYGDKMFVSAGYRVLSGTNSQVLFESSTGAFTTIGGFEVGQGTAVASSGFGFVQNAGSGTAGQTSDKSVPYTAVSATTFDNAQSGIANEVKLRINQVAQTFTTTTGSSDSGTGNFGNFATYIGARAGTSIWFNGRLYGLTVAGKQASASEISGNEYFLNSKTNAY